MFFLIRCVFWLTIVYTTIFSPDSPKPESRPQQAAQKLPSAAQAGELAQAWFSSAVAVVEDEAARHCAKTPAECIAIAKRLSDIAADRHILRATPALARFSAPLVNVPLPPRRPRTLTSEKTARGLEKSSQEEYLMGYSGRS